MWFVSCLALMIFLVTFLATLKQLKFVLFFAVWARFEFGTSISIEIDAVWVTWYYVLRCCHLRGMTLCSKMLQPTWPHHIWRCGWLHDLYDRALGLIMWKWGCLHDMNMTWYLIWIHLKVWSLKLHDITLKMCHSFTGKNGKKREDVRWISAFRVCFMDVGIEPWTYPSKFGWPNSGPDFIQQVLLPSLELARPSKWTCPRWKLKSSCPAMKIWWCTSDPTGENRCRKCPAGPWSTVLLVAKHLSKELKKHQDMMIEFAVRMYPCLRVFNIGCFDDSCLFCFSIPVIVYWQSTSLPRDLCLRDSLKATALAWHGYWTNDGTDGSAGRSLICGETTPFWPLHPSPSLTLRRGLGFDIVGGCLLVHRSGMNATAFFFLQPVIETVQGEEFWTRESWYQWQLPRTDLWWRCRI